MGDTELEDKPAAEEVVTDPPAEPVAAEPAEPVNGGQAAALERYQQELRETRERAERLEADHALTRKELEELKAKAAVDPNAAAKDAEERASDPVGYMERKQKERDELAARKDQIAARQKDFDTAKENMVSAPEYKSDPKFKERFGAILADLYPDDDNYTKTKAAVQFNAAMKHYRALYPAAAPGPKIVRTPPGGGPGAPGAALGGEGSGPPTEAEYAQAMADMQVGIDENRLSKGHRTYLKWQKEGRIAKVPW